MKLAVDKDILFGCAAVNRDLRSLLHLGTTALVSFELENRAAVVDNLIDQLRRALLQLNAAVAERPSDATPSAIAALDFSKKVADQFHELISFPKMELSHVTERVSDLEHSFVSALHAIDAIYASADGPPDEVQGSRRGPNDYEYANSIHHWVMDSWRERQ